MGAVGWLDAVLRELLLFAGAGILIGGVDDLAVDFAYFFRLGWQRLTGMGDGLPSLADLPSPDMPGRFVVFVPAWDEAAVIGPMLRTALARFDHADYAIYVGCYPNDPATVAAVSAISAQDERVRLVIGPRAGPTTKADCLNALWRAFIADDGGNARAVVLHDAEDVVHPAEFAVFDALIGRYPVVQLPVLPLAQPRSPLVAGCYSDEFAESHGRTLVVRELVGAAMPLAGVGCAIALPVLEAIARNRGGAPFDPGSLTEDYELGLAAAAIAGPGTLARVRETPGGPVIAVREYFPARLDASVRQKARWMHGIALAGWDRTGWSRPFAIGDHWMRLRDRRGPLAVLVLVAAYLSLALAAMSAGLHWWQGGSLPVGDWLALVLRVNAALLAWRVAVRAGFVAHAYGWREAAWALPRMVSGNIIAMLAARRALAAYLGTLHGAALRWEKTSHAFPTELGGAGPA